MELEAGKIVELHHEIKKETSGHSLYNQCGDRQ